MKRKYIQVSPSRESLNPDNIVSHISSLHKLTSRQNNSSSISDKVNPFKDTNNDVPEFEFIAFTQGLDGQVKFAYSCEEQFLNSLKNKLITAYPSSFDISIEEIDLLKELTNPEEYAPDDFVKEVEEGKLQFDLDAVGTPKDIEGVSDEEDSVESDGVTDPSSADSQPIEDGGRPGGGQELSQPEKDEESSTPDGEESDGDGKPDPRDADEHIPVNRSSPTTVPNDSREIVKQGGVTEIWQPDDFREDTDSSESGGDGSPSESDVKYQLLEDYDESLVDLVELPDDFEAELLEHQIDGPTWTEDGNILARPSLENIEPISVRWKGSAERKKDWMTTLKMFSKVAEPESDDITERAPLAAIVQKLANADVPIAYQVVFKAIDDWSKAAEKRKDDLHLNRDTLGQKIVYEAGEVLFSPSKERRRERRRDHLDDIGESAGTNEETPVSGKIGDRRKLIDNKLPKRTFRANIRAVSLANDEDELPEVRQTMDEIAATLDHLDGYFYGLEPEVLEDREGRLRTNNQATEETHRLLNREIVSASGKKRPDIIVNADELSNFLAVPSSRNLTVSGVRGTRAKPESRDPLPKPDPDLMREFHKPGMRIGYALDKEAEREPVPTQVPPELLTTHFFRTATTGAGKSIGLINDMLSLYENTDGPTILIDPKGDGMTENYLKSHTERFGEEDVAENVIHFPIPEILPGFTFFNIQPALDRGVRREDAIQNKADHYEDLLKLVMGVERYENSKVAPIIIGALIKSLFDEGFYEKKVEERKTIADNDEDGTAAPVDLSERESPNKFKHRHLALLAKELRRYGVTDGDEGYIPEVSQRAVKDTLEDQAKGDTRTFSQVMNAVTNRLNYIREDAHLRRIFNNTEPRFDFRDHLNDDKIILFDLGELRDDATKVMTGLILTNLWDALTESGRQTKCAKGHEDFDECREVAEKNGLDPENPPCHEPWDDDHLVNIIIDESASVAVSSIMDKMLEQGRSFHMSVGLGMQFPEQMKSAGRERTYQNVLNNISTLLVGKIKLDEEIAKAMAHEEMDVTDFRNRIRSLPRGEWIVQLPSPEFMETGPNPFSLQPLPIPAGHPEAKKVLSEEAKQRFDHILENEIHPRSQQKYGAPRPDDDDDEDDVDVDYSGEGTGDDGDDDGSSDSGEDGDNSSEEERSDGEDSTAESQSDESDDDSGENDDEDIPIGEYKDTIDTDADVDSTTDDGETQSPSDGQGKKAQQIDLPPHVDHHPETDTFRCKNCSGIHQKMEAASRCCYAELLDKYSPTAGSGVDPRHDDAHTTYITTIPTRSVYTSEEGVESITPVTDGDTNLKPTVTVETTLPNDRTTLKENPLAGEVETVKSINDIGEFLNSDHIDTQEDYESLLVTILSSVPPDKHRIAEKLGDWLLEQSPYEHDPQGEGWDEIIRERDPFAIPIDSTSLLNDITNSTINEQEVHQWGDLLEKGKAPVARLFNGRISVPDTNLARQGHYKGAYRTDAADFTIDPHVREAKSWKDVSDLDPKYLIEVTGQAKLSQAHLDEFDINAEEAAFMMDIVSAMNRGLEGYEPTMSMKQAIADQYESVDIDRLIDLGYLETEHMGRGNAEYYYVTYDGQEAIDAEKEFGPGVGDIGDKTGHRIGTWLAEEYYKRHPDMNVASVRSFIERNDHGDIIDFEALDEDNNTVVSVEVESGTINNYKSIREDAELLAETPGESVWVARNKLVAKSILQALRAEGEIEIPDDALEKLSNGKYDIVNEEYIQNLEHKGIDRIISFTHLLDEISTFETQSTTHSERGHFGKESQ